MAARKTFLTLDLGMQRVRLAEFCISPDGKPILLRGACRNLLNDPALDASRPEQIRQALKDIMGSWKLKSGTVSCVLPAHSVFVRAVPIDVPGGLSGQVEALARFEAQQNIPFSLDEVVWDHVVMGELPGGAVNVIFLAVKRDLLETLCSAVEGAGLKIAAVTVALLALHDALRFSGTTEQFPGTTLLIDMGSRTTNLILSPGPLFCRSIPSGGLAITSAISKDTHTTLDEAEALKISRGSVDLGPNYTPPADPVEANLSKVVRQTLIRIQAEIARSLSFYRSNLGGTEPDRILLTGGTAALPYFAEFLQEKFQKPVAFWNAADGFESSPDNPSNFAAENPNNMGELLGGALQFLPGRKHTRVRLLPPTLAGRNSFAERLPTLAAAASLFLLALASWGVFADLASGAIRRETAKFTEETARLGQLSKKIDSLTKTQKEIRSNASSILSVALLREPYPKIISELALAVPERHLWITEVQVAGEPTQKDPAAKTADTELKAVVVKGLYLDNPHQAALVDDFVTNLQNSPFFAIEEKDKSKVITQRSGPTAEYWAYPFALRIPLRKPLPPAVP